MIPSPRDLYGKTWPLPTTPSPCVEGEPIDDHTQIPDDQEQQAADAAIVKEIENQRATEPTVTITISGLTVDELAKLIRAAR